MGGGLVGGEWVDGWMGIEQMDGWMVLYFEWIDKYSFWWVLGP